MSVPALLLPPSSVVGARAVRGRAIGGPWPLGGVAFRGAQGLTMTTPKKEMDPPQGVQQSEYFDGPFIGPFLGHPFSAPWAPNVGPKILKCDLSAFRGPILAPMFVSYSIQKLIKSGADKLL